MAAARPTDSEQKSSSERSSKMPEQTLVDAAANLEGTHDPGLDLKAENVYTNVAISCFSELEIQDWDEVFDKTHYIPRWVDLLKCAGCKTTTAKTWYNCNYGHFICNVCRIDFAGFPEDINGLQRVCPYTEPDPDGITPIECYGYELHKCYSVMAEKLRNFLKISPRPCPFEGCFIDNLDGMGGPEFEKHLSLCDFNGKRGCPFSDCWDGGFTVIELVDHLTKIHLLEQPEKDHSEVQHKLTSASSGESAVIVLQLPEINEWELTRERKSEIKSSLFLPHSIYDVEVRRELMEESDWAPVMIQFEEIHFLLRIRKRQGRFWGWVERLECNYNADVQYVAQFEIRQPDGQKIFTGKVSVIAGNVVPEVEFAALPHRRVVMEWEKFVQYCSWNVLQKTITTQFKITIRRQV